MRYQPNPEAVCEAVAQLIEFLRSLDGDDAARGRSAAQNLEHTLALLRSRPDFENGLAHLAGDVGGKGMLDWIWTDEHRAKLDEFSHRIFLLLRSGQL